MDNNIRQSLYNKFKSYNLKIHIQTLNEPNITFSEQILIEIVAFSNDKEKQFNNVVQLFLEDEIPNRQYYPMINHCFREICNLYEDFYLLFNFIIQQLENKLINKNYNKFEKFISSRYENLLLEINIIKNDSDNLSDKCIYKDE